jgi:hypothetical protein
MGVGVGVGVGEELSLSLPRIKREAVSPNLPQRVQVSAVVQCVGVGDTG